MEYYHGRAPKRKMTTAKRTSDDEGRIVHGGELPEGDSTLDDVVVDAPQPEKPKGERKVNVYYQIPREISPDIAITFVYILKDNPLSINVAAASSQEFLIPKLIDGKVKCVKAEWYDKIQGFTTNIALKHLGYEAGREHGEKVLGPDCYTDFLYDITAANNCTVNFHTLMESVYRMREEHSEVVQNLIAKSFEHEEEIKKLKEFGRILSTENRDYEKKIASQDDYIRNLTGELKATQDDYQAIRGAYKSGFFSRVCHAFMMLLGIEPKEK
jgi:hypothetical protein